MPKASVHSQIHELLQEKAVREILVNGHKDVWVEREDGLEKIDSEISSEMELQQFVRSLLSPMGRKIDFKSPYVDARLSNGSRLCAIIPPATLGGTHLSIRKFNTNLNSLEELHKNKTVNEKALRIIHEAIENKKNILISGASSTGKTTLLNAIAAKISPKERIITLEDTAELSIAHPHVVRLESRPPNSEGEGEITLRDLLQTALRMRPDRLIIGECRGKEALDLLLALNTGHNGSMATIHSNSPRDSLRRLELLCGVSQQYISPQLIQSYICASIHLLIHLVNEKTNRRIESIQQVCGLESGVFLLRTLL